MIKTKLGAKQRKIEIIPTFGYQKLGHNAMLYWTFLILTTQNQLISYDEYVFCVD
jgi:hypothetical protein